MCFPSPMVTISICALMVLVGAATFTAGVVLLVRAKGILQHFSQPPPPGTNHYEMVDEGEKRAPLGAGVYEEVDKQDRQTDEHTKHYQELDLAKMEKKATQLAQLDSSLCELERTNNAVVKFAVVKCISECNECTIHVRQAHCYSASLVAPLRFNQLEHGVVFSCFITNTKGLKQITKTMQQPHWACIES